MVAHGIPLILLHTGGQSLEWIWSTTSPSDASQITDWSPQLAAHNSSYLLAERLGSLIQQLQGSNLDVGNQMPQLPTSPVNIGPHTARLIVGPILTYLPGIIHNSGDN